MATMAEKAHPYECVAKKTAHPTLTDTLGAVNSKQERESAINEKVPLSCPHYLYGLINEIKTQGRTIRDDHARRCGVSEEMRCKEDDWESNVKSKVTTR